MHYPVPPFCFIQFQDAVEFRRQCGDLGWISFYAGLLCDVLPFVGHMKLLHSYWYLTPRSVPGLYCTAHIEKTCRNAFNILCNGSELF